MTHHQVSCTSRLVQVSCTRFLTTCHQHKETERTDLYEWILPSSTRAITGLQSPRDMDVVLYMLALQCQYHRRT